MRAIGIDLGTTNSVAAACDDKAAPRILENGQSQRSTPSVVSVTGEKVTVGQYAVNNARRAPQDTIVSVKRLMGRDFDDPEIENVHGRVNYELARGPDEDPRVHVVVDGTTRSPVEISAMILRKIKDDASRKLGEEVTHAVITVPAYFKEGQRAATREAGEMAGLVVRRILDEPTAAAIAFGVEVPNPDRHRILVFDLGGGTFDVSILQMVHTDDGPHFVVIDYGGDNWLGGDDFDYVIVDRIVGWISDRYGDPGDDLRFRLEAKTAAEQAKRELSEADEAVINIPRATKIAGVDVDVDMTITRAEYEDAVREAVDRAVSEATETLTKQQLATEDISDVLLVGGSTMTPLVQQRIEGVFGRAKVRRTVNPMECVALGAAVLASAVAGVGCPGCDAVNDENSAACSACGATLAAARTVGTVSVDDVTGMSLGIRAVRDDDPDVFVPIIPNGTAYPLPTPMKREFQATDRMVRIPVFEGNDPVASKNTEQGVIEVELPENHPANSPVEVSLNFDRNRIITVNVSVPGTDVFRTEQLSRGKRRSRPGGGGDGAGRSEEEELNGLIESTQRFLDTYERYIPTEHARRLREDIGHAVRGTGGPRIAQLIMNDIYTCEVAYRLWSADRARHGASPKETREITEAVKPVQELWKAGDHTGATEQSKVLNALLKRILEDRRDVTAVSDRHYEGLLEVLTGD